MRNSAHVPLLDVMREAHRFARSIGATDEDLGGVLQGFGNNTGP
jgi:hypothetical protein